MVEYKSMERFKLIFTRQENGSWFCLAKDEVGKTILDLDGNSVECCLPTKEESALCVLKQLSELK